MAGGGSDVVVDYLNGFAAGQPAEKLAGAFPSGYLIWDGETAFVPPQDVSARIAALQISAVERFERLTWDLVELAEIIPGIRLVNVKLCWSGPRGRRLQRVSYLVAEGPRSASSSIVAVLAAPQSPPDIGRAQPLSPEEPRLCPET